MGSNLLAKAIFLGYSGGLRTMRNKQILVRIDQIDDENKAARYIGRKVTWKTLKGKLIIGKIVSPHGGNGVLKAMMREGLPGQAVGKELDIS